MKVKKNTFEKMCAPAQERDDQVEVVIADTFKFKVKRYLTMTERTAMVYEIADMVIPEDTLEYRPFFRGFAILYATIKYCTDLDMSALEAEDNFIDRLMAANDNYSLQREIERQVDGGMLFDVFNNADAVIGSRRRTAEFGARFGKLIDVLVPFIEVLTAQPDGEELPEGLTAEDMLKMAQSAQGIDEGEIVKKVLDYQSEKEDKATRFWSKRKRGKSNGDTQ